MNIARRHEAIRRAVTPLPGSQPYDNFKPVNVPEDCDGKTLLETLCRDGFARARSYWEAECARGLVVNLRREADCRRDKSSARASVTCTSFRM